MLFATHRVKLDALSYTWTEAMCSLLSEALCSLLYVE